MYAYENSFLINKLLKINNIFNDLPKIFHIGSIRQGIEKCL